MWGEEEKRLEEMEEEDDGVKEGEEGAEQEFNKVSRKKKMTGMRQSYYSTAHHIANLNHHSVQLQTRCTI